MAREVKAVKLIRLNTIQRIEKLNLAMGLISFQVIGVIFLIVWLIRRFGRLLDQPESLEEIRNPQHN
jgi:flagellar biogenesis protein FliO